MSMFLAFIGSCPDGSCALTVVLMIVPSGRKMSLLDVMCSTVVSLLDCLTADVAPELMVVMEF